MTERPPLPHGGDSMSIDGPAEGAAAPSAGEPILELREVVKEFGGVRALDGVSVSVRPGEVTALVGENGAGKSTLIGCVAGNHRPDSGELLMAGAPVTFTSPFSAREAGIETVYQDLALAENLDVAANIFLGREERHGALRGFGLKKRAMRQRAAEMLQDMGVSVPAVGIEVRSLSGGQRQSVSIARATGWGAKLVMMDEPTAALGVRETERVLGLVKELATRGLGVLVISHNLDDVFAVSDQIWVLRRGALVAGRRTKETSHAEIVHDITGLTRA
jgi:simple sugar transport system ATP-binding protein